MLTKLFELEFDILKESIELIYVVRNNVNYSMNIFEYNRFPKYVKLSQRTRLYIVDEIPEPLFVKYVWHCL